MHLSEEEKTNLILLNKSFFVKSKKKMSSAERFIFRPKNLDAVELLF